MKPLTKRLTAVVVAGWSTLLLVTGCSDNVKIKEEVLEALHKQADIYSYTFAGRSELKLDDTFPLSDTNPLTASLLHSLTNSNMEWSGAVSLNPLRMESKLMLTPTGGKALPEIPVILNNNKLYMQIPLLNPNNEYISVDLSAAASGLTLSSQTYARWIEGWLTSIEAKWFKRMEDTEEDNYPHWASIAITESNAKVLSALLQSKLLEWCDELLKQKLITKSQADGFKNKWSHTTLALQAPGYIRTSVRKDGFLEELQADIHFVLLENGKTSREQILKFNNKWGEINQVPSFTQEIPANALPIDEILKGFMK
jgi:hypothetical protein